MSEIDYETAKVSDEELRCAGITRDELKEKVMQKGPSPCGTTEAWISTRQTNDSVGYCAVNGAHLSHYIEIGCEDHTYYGGTVGEEIGRYCPQDCAWSRALDEEEDE